MSMTPVKPNLTLRVPKTGGPVELPRGKLEVPYWTQMVGVLLRVRGKLKGAHTQGATAGLETAQARALLQELSLDWYYGHGEKRRPYRSLSLERLESTILPKTFGIIGPTNQVNYPQNGTWGAFRCAVVQDTETDFSFELPVACGRFVGVRGLEDVMGCGRSQALATRLVLTKTAVVQLPAFAGGAPGPSITDDLMVEVIPLKVPSPLMDVWTYFPEWQEYRDSTKLKQLDAGLYFAVDELSNKFAETPIEFYTLDVNGQAVIDDLDPQLVDEMAGFTAGGAFIVYGGTESDTTPLFRYQLDASLADLKAGVMTVKLREQYFDPSSANYGVLASPVIERRELYEDLKYIASQLRNAPVHAVNALHAMGRKWPDSLLHYAPIALLEANHPAVAQNTYILAPPNKDPSVQAPRTLMEDFRQRANSLGARNNPKAAQAQVQAFAASIPQVTGASGWEETDSFREARSILGA